MCLFNRRSGSDHFVYIRGRWLHRGYMYIVRISSLALYMYMYIQVIFADFENTSSSLTESLYRNRHDKEPLENDLGTAVWSQVSKGAYIHVHCERMENTDYIFPSLFYSFLFVSRSMKIFIELWKSYWESEISYEDPWLLPLIYVLFSLL